MGTKCQSGGSGGGDDDSVPYDPGGTEHGRRAESTRVAAEADHTSNEADIDWEALKVFPNALEVVESVTGHFSKLPDSAQRMVASLGADQARIYLQARKNCKARAKVTTIRSRLERRVSEG